MRQQATAGQRKEEVIDGAPSRQPSEGFGAGFTGADADDLLDSGYKNLAVTNFSGIGGADNGIHSLFDLLVTLVVAGPWMLTLLTDYMRRLFESIPGMIG